MADDDRIREEERRSEQVANLVAAMYRLLQASGPPLSKISVVISYANGELLTSEVSADPNEVVAPELRDPKARC